MGDQPMSQAAPTRPDLRDMSAGQVDELLDTLTPQPVTPDQEAGLLAMLPPPGDPPEAPLNVVRSLRLPADLNRRLEEAADDQGVPTSVFIRRAIESALAGRVTTNLVSLEDVLRAIQSVPKAAA